MAWLILVVYVIGFLFTARKIALHLIEEDASRELEHRAEMRKSLYGRRPEERTTPLVSSADRVMNTFVACMPALAWPLVLIVWAASRSLRSPSERIEAERVQSETDRRELAALRKQAIQLGLPMPGEDS